MTPFEVSLESELSIESTRFANEWLFKWHNLNIPGHTVDVDRFDGGQIHLGGITFGHQQQQIFWQAIGLYLNRKIHEIFGRWDAETRTYPNNMRRASIDGVEQRLQQFVVRIVKHSTDTDRRLRGRGFPEKVPAFDSTAYQSRAKAEILRVAASHRALLDQSNATQLLSRKQRVENYLSNHKGIMTAIALAVAVIGLVVREFVK